PFASTVLAAGKDLGACDVVLVHGIYADESFRADFIGYLHASGITATSVQNPLPTLDAFGAYLHG
ncbi:MAG TPA: hypothetical protein VMR39_18940, partial [Sphingobium sp.]|nr:hypothetical protein [Sphingobium sp.]